MPDSITPNHNTQPIHSRCSGALAEAATRRRPGHAHEQAGDRQQQRERRRSRDVPEHVERIARALDQHRLHAAHATTARCWSRARSRYARIIAAIDSAIDRHEPRARRRDDPRDHHHDERNHELPIAGPLEQVQHLPQEEPPHHRLAARRRDVVQREEHDLADHQSGDDRERRRATSDDDRRAIEQPAERRESRRA